jgi:hypothetical protein
MALHDLSDISHRVCQYIYDNSNEHDFGGFALRQNDHETVSISDWTYAFPEPNYSTLRDIDYSSIVAWYEEQMEIRKIIKLPVLTTAAIASISAEDGMMVFDRTANRIKVYHSGSWNRV